MKDYITNQRELPARPAKSAIPQDGSIGDRGGSNRNKPWAIGNVDCEQRPASADEQAMLLLDPSQTTAHAELSSCLCLLALPAHLRAAFWDLLARAPEAGAGRAEGFGTFVAETARFLDFKQLPVPAGAVFDLVVTRPGPAPSLSTAALWGLINLGEAAASVVFLNVPASEVPATDYPPVRLQLGPGEGARVPAGILICVGECERDQPDVLLLIRLPEACGGEASRGEEALASEKRS
jgi:hypothetical protein